ncbi:MAG: sigma 54-interacting transcriptional regulator [Candidatus Aminicenantes bacterium]|nr:sigma 54-interacting transcriptional regulator [Acidobacteriota bacterium]MCG2811964.1 sigma 54-interacting transcriptional regulator [Candidatus Aminicenantes bacterium]
MPNATIFPQISNLPDPKSLAVKAAVEKVAGLDTPVLLWGETGSGKDFWAAVLAGSSPFQPLLNLGCGDVPETLLESEWFGYQKGAFSGADRDFLGKWRQAGNGTIFLNQIDLLSLHMQAKLLRVIERKKIFPLGCNQEADIAARFLFSADSTIEEKVRRGEFRADLYYRISTVSIFIPPLRERKKDILPLLNYFCAEKGVKIQLSEEARQKLLQYPWPGNIRELKNFVSGLAVRGCILDEKGVWTLLDRPRPILDLIQSGERSLAEVEAEYTAYLLRKYKNKSKVARILNISRKSLYNKLKKHEDH